MVTCHDSDCVLSNAGWDMGIVFLYASFILFFGLAAYRWRYSTQSWKEILSFFALISLLRWFALSFK